MDPPATKLRVLVVDDEQVIANTLAIILNQAGFEALAAHSGPRAVTASEHFKPQFLITNIYMEGTNSGLKAALEIHAQFPSCKVYFFDSARHEREVRDANSLAGTTFAFLPMPVHPTDLLTKLREETAVGESTLVTPKDDLLAVTVVGDRFKLVAISPDGNCSFVEEVQRLQSILYVWSAETLALKAAVDELEDLINNAGTRERDLQEFFERNPGLIKGEEYKAAHPHVVLSRDEGSLIPDFVLEPHSSGELCDLLDLKLPNAKIFTLKPNRDRYSSAVVEGCAQLRAYARFFDESRNRRLIAERYNLQAYKPRMFLIIGRKGSVDPIQRKDISLDLPGVELRTYDDIVARAKTRLSAMARGYRH